MGMMTNGHRGEKGQSGHSATLWADTHGTAAFGRTDTNCLHTLFEARAAKAPDAIALTAGTSQLSYGALNAHANRLARHLRRIGIGPDDRVVLCLERSREMVIGLLAILKAGGAYVPLDPDQPHDRLLHILHDCAPKAILTHAATWDRLGAVLPDLPRTPAVIDLDEPRQWAGYDGTNLDAMAIGVTGRSLAYVVYADDKAGVAHGVMVEHRNVVRLFSATMPLFRFGAGDVWTLFHSLALDFSVWETWGALLHGGRLIVIAQSTIDNPRAFYGLLCRERVTILNQAPSSFQRLIAAQAASSLRHGLRSVVLATEALDTPRLLPWATDPRNARTELVSMYGTAETTVHATYHPLMRIGGQADWAIGHPVPDSRIHLLDRDRAPVPVGTPGEIYVGGAGIARGYLNCPDLTLERFVESPFVAGDRLYRTGDLGRSLPDGMIEFLGPMVAG